MDWFASCLELVKYGAGPLAAVYITRMYMLGKNPRLDVKVGGVVVSIRRDTERRRIASPRYRQAVAPKVRKRRRRR